VDISSGLAPGSASATLTVAGSALGNKSTPRSRNENVPRHDERHDQHGRRDRPADAEFRQHAILPVRLKADTTY
jgi:hypothetical protein